MTERALIAAIDAAWEDRAALTPAAKAPIREAVETALDLLDRMLAFDPSSRISVEDALEHRYLHIWHDASDEPACPTTFDFAFEVVEDVAEMRRMILDEVHRFRRSVRQAPQASSKLEKQTGLTYANQEQVLAAWMCRSHTTLGNIELRILVRKRLVSIMQMIWNMSCRTERMS